jgi:hypothetical protein
MNGIELFERIKQVSTFSDLLSTFIGKTSGEMQSKRGNLFEKVCSIIIKFGFSRHFQMILTITMEI